MDDVDHIPLDSARVEEIVPIYQATVEVAVVAVHVLTFGAVVVEVAAEVELGAAAAVEVEDQVEAAAEERMQDIADVHSSLLDHLALLMVNEEEDTGGAAQCSQDMASYQQLM